MKIALRVIAIWLALLGSSYGATTIIPAHADSWSANTGFWNWRPSTADGVNIGAHFCAGYIYGAGMSWLDKDGADGTPANGTSYT